MMGVVGLVGLVVIVGMVVELAIVGLVMVILHGMSSSDTPMRGLSLRHCQCPCIPHPQPHNLRKY